MVVPPLKRPATDVLDGIGVLLVDIEGTTTPITFVKDILFPYVTENLEGFLKTNYDQNDCQDDIKLLRELAKKDKEKNVEDVTEIPDDNNSNKESVIEAVVANVKWQMSQDRKSRELKQLQGHIWKKAYEEGKIKGSLFPDVVPTLRKMIDQKIKIYIYSSGSIQSQKLLFSNSTDGNVIDLFSGHFDTTIGNKMESESYQKIAEEIGKNPHEILFLTDNPKEAAAALKSGLQCKLVVREGNAPLSEDDKRKYEIITSFSALIGAEKKQRTLSKEENLPKNTKA